MHWFSPSPALALPCPAIHIHTAVPHRPVCGIIPMPPAYFWAIRCKMLSTAEGPHVVKCPHERFADPAYILDRHHLRIHPMQIDDVGIAAIDRLRPARRQHVERMGGGTGCRQKRGWISSKNSARRNDHPVSRSVTSFYSPIIRQFALHPHSAHKTGIDQCAV